MCILLINYIPLLLIIFQADSVFQMDTNTTAIYYNGVAFDIYPLCVWILILSSLQIHHFINYFYGIKISSRPWMWTTWCLFNLSQPSWPNDNDDRLRLQQVPGMVLPSSQGCWNLAQKENTVTNWAMNITIFSTNMLTK